MDKHGNIECKVEKNAITHLLKHIPLKYSLQITNKHPKNF